MRHRVRTVASHPWIGEDLDSAWVDAEKLLFGWTGGRLERVLDTSVQQLGRAVILERPWSDWLRCMERIRDVAMALFLGRACGRTAPNWMLGYAASRAIRDRESALVLAASAPIRFVGEDEDYDAYRAEIARALCAWELGQDWSPGLLAAQELSLRATVNIDFAMTMGCPLLGMVLALRTCCPDAFNASLYASLAGHREVSVGSVSLEPASAIALVPLGLCCLASDIGIPMEVTSPYVPSRFVDGDLS